MYSVLLGNESSSTHGAMTTRWTTGRSERASEQSLAEQTLNTPGDFTSHGTTELTTIKSRESPSVAATLQVYKYPKAASNRGRAEEQWILDGPEEQPQQQCVNHPDHNSSSVSTILPILFHMSGGSKAAEPDGSGQDYKPWGFIKPGEGAF